MYDIQGKTQKLSETLEQNKIRLPQRRVKEEELMSSCLSVWVELGPLTAVFLKTPERTAVVSLELQSVVNCRVVLENLTWLSCQSLPGFMKQTCRKKCAEGKECK